MITIRRATLSDAETISSILQEAVDWLRSRGLDQWGGGFPASRIWPIVESGDFFLVSSDTDADVGCFTLSYHGDPEFWSGQERSEPALYLSKLAVRRRANGVGSLILQWCLTYGHRRHVAWIRCDAWKTNADLHGYYQRQGFTHVRTVDLPHRRSGALFQKATQSIDLEVSEMLGRELKLGNLVANPPLSHGDGWPGDEESTATYYVDAGATIRVQYPWANSPKVVAFVAGFTYRVKWNADRWKLHVVDNGQTPDGGDPLVTYSLENGIDTFSVEHSPTIRSADDDVRPWLLRRDRDYLVRAANTDEPDTAVEIIECAAAP